MENGKRRRLQRHNIMQYLIVAKSQKTDAKAVLTDIH